MHWLEENQLEWAAPVGPLQWGTPPFVATEEEFAAFVSGSSEKLWVAAMKNPLFQEWLRDNQNKDIDTTTSMRTDQITVGQLAGLLKFETATDTQGYKSLATVSFTTRGQVPIGGKIVIVMPDLGGETDRGWHFESASLFFAASM